MFFLKYINRSFCVIKYLCVQCHPIKPFVEYLRSKGGFVVKNKRFVNQIQNSIELEQLDYITIEDNCCLSQFGQMFDLGVFWLKSLACCY